LRGKKVEEVSRSLRRLTNYAAGLQDLFSELQQAAPGSSQGSDRSGAVQAVLGPDGLPESIRVHVRWNEKLQADAFAAAVSEACQAAMRERGLAWSRVLEKSGWQQRADRLKNGPASTPSPAPGAIPPAFRRADGAGRRRSAERMAEEVIELLDAASERAAGGRPQNPRGQAIITGSGLTLTLSNGGQVSCQADPKWVAGKSAAQLSEALSMALVKARQALKESGSSASDSQAQDLISRQEHLMADLLTALDDPRSSF
jgi:hypothetical protein